MGNILSCCCCCGGGGPIQPLPITAERLYSEMFIRDDARQVDVPCGFSLETTAPESGNKRMRHYARNVQRESIAEQLSIKEDDELLFLGGQPLVNKPHRGVLALASRQRVAQTFRWVIRRPSSRDPENGWEYTVIEGEVKYQQEGENPNSVVPSDELPIRKSVAQPLRSGLPFYLAVVYALRKVYEFFNEPVYVQYAMEEKFIKHENTQQYMWNDGSTHSIEFKPGDDSHEFRKTELTYRKSSDLEAGISQTYTVFRQASGSTYKVITQLEGSLTMKDSHFDGDWPTVIENIVFKTIDHTADSKKRAYKSMLTEEYLTVASGTLSLIEYSGDLEEQDNVWFTLWDEAS